MRKKGRNEKGSGKEKGWSKSERRVKMRRQGESQKNRMKVRKKGESEKKGWK